MRVLRYFLEIAREGNMTHAAQRLHISQPTLSRQIKELEEELGKKLFTRSNYSVSLTEEGMLLRKRAEDILAMADKTIEEFHTLDKVYGGDIRIGCAESSGITPFIQVLQKLNQTYPRIRYHFYSSGTETVQERLDRGLLDLAIIVQEADPAKYNSLRIPASDQWGLIMRKDSPLAQHSCIHLHDLMEVPLILSRQAMGEEMPRWFGETQDKLHIVATYDLLFSIPRSWCGKDSVMCWALTGSSTQGQAVIYVFGRWNQCWNPPCMSSFLWHIPKLNKAVGSAAWAVSDL